jgi:hypothetical protein
VKATWILAVTAGAVLALLLFGTADWWPVGVLIAGVVLAVVVDERVTR